MGRAAPAERPEDIRATDRRRPATTEAGAAIANVSVVVATYSEARFGHLRACLRSLRGQTTPPREVIVVVDHNDPLAVRVAREFGWARVIRNHRSRGLAGARNTGIEAARAPLVAFIDDDAAAEPGWLSSLVRCIGETAAVGAGGALVPRWEAGRPVWLADELLWVVGCSYAGLPTERAPVRNPIGANMAVRAAALRAVEGFRDGSEYATPRAIRARGVVRAAGNVPDDTDLAIRVSGAIPGAIWLHEPTAVVRHSVTSERVRPGYFLRRCFEEGAGKASLAGLVGAGPALVAERRHVARVLPRALARELRRLAAGEWTAGTRALAIIAGSAAAASGFVVASVTRRVRGEGGRR